MEQSRILITGANGLIGNAIFQQLSKVGNYVIGVDNNSRTGSVQNNQVISQDLLTFYKENKNNFDYIFHFAAINGTESFYKSSNTVLETNLKLDLATFEFAKKNPLTKLIYASSSEVVSGDESVPTSELTDIKIQNIHNPRWSYRLAKIAGENYLTNSALNFLIIRFFNVFSENSRPGHFVYDISKKIQENNFKLIGANETRSFCYIDDAVDAITAIAPTVSNKVVNIGNDEEISILDAANIIAAVQFDKKVDWVTQTGLKGSTARRCPDISQLRQLYPDYNPISFKKAIETIKNKTVRKNEKNNF